ncbi:MAG TPA: HAMP domain-containing sensor histidine kinase [Acidimicrobiales bacterium]|nr:HAMP domain-containing sensor histidine kinase [Acidimicrobiales bacterium]
MSLQKRLVALVALLLVVGLLVADVVIYASVRSFLYGQADNTLVQNEALGFEYLNYADDRGIQVTEADLSHHVSPEVYVTLLGRDGRVILRRPSGPPTQPDPAPVLTGDLPVQQVPDIARHHVGRYAGSFHPDPDAVVLRSTGDPDGQYRTLAVTVPQGTLVTSLSLNPTNDTLASLRRVELLASLAILVAMGALVLVVVRRGLRPLRQMAGTANAIASGDLTRRVPEGPPGTEVAQLGQALNEMLAQIEGAFAEKSASEERLRQFVADASHELRTPLTSIRGYAELLARGGFSDDAGRRKALKRIEEEATRMGGLVEDLLLLAELDRGRPLRAEPVDLQRICADAVGDTHAAPHGHVLRLAPGQPVLVLGDAERLAQVAHNLIRNALAHTPDGTEVTVSTGVAGRMGYLQVADDGPGIPPAEAARVFDRFYQGDPSRSAAGTGLGLAIVRAIAEALGGTAEVVRSGPGANLQVKIPLAAAPGGQAPAPAPPAARSVQLH